MVQSTNWASLGCHAEAGFLYAALHCSSSRLKWSGSCFSIRGSLLHGTVYIRSCCCFQGLIKYDYSSGDITILATHVSNSSLLDPGSEITYANDLAVAPDGTIYFTSCTDIIPPLNHLGFYDTYRAWFLGLMQVMGTCYCLMLAPSSCLCIAKTSTLLGLCVRCEML